MTPLTCPRTGLPAKLETTTTNGTVAYAYACATCQFATFRHKARADAAAEWHKTTQEAYDKR